LFCKTNELPSPNVVYMKLVAVKTFTTRAEAEIAKGLLEAHKIPATILADDEGGMAQFPFRPSAEGVRPLVRETDFNKADRLLKNKKSTSRRK